MYVDRESEREKETSYTRSVCQGERERPRRGGRERNGLVGIAYLRMNLNGRGRLFPSPCSPADEVTTMTRHECAQRGYFGLRPLNLLVNCADVATRMISVGLSVGSNTPKTRAGKEIDFPYALDSIFSHSLMSWGWEQPATALPRYQRERERERTCPTLVPLPGS